MRVFTLLVLGMFFLGELRSTPEAQAQADQAQALGEQNGRAADSQDEPLDLGDFELPLEYAPDEEEGQGWLCPSLQPLPRQRAIFIVRQEMIARTEPEGETVSVELFFPAPRNLGEQRRLASRIRVNFGSHENLIADEEVLEHTADLIYSQPYNNPFLRVRFDAPDGVVTVQVDSWISNARPPAGKVKDQAERFLRMKRSPRALQKFNESYGVSPVLHWAEPEGEQPRGPDIVAASGKTPFELAFNVVKQTAQLVPYQAGLHMTDPFQVIKAAGGDAESRATVVWYALQHEMSACQVSGYNRQYVDTSFSGFDAWNAMVLDGFCVADVGGKDSSYLGHDHAQFIATSIGTDHILEDYPQVPRHISYSAGMYFHGEGRVTMRQYASLIATSGLAFDLPDGRYTFPKTDGTKARGETAAELDEQLRNPPPGILQLAEEVAEKRREVNGR